MTLKLALIYDEFKKLKSGYSRSLDVILAEESPYLFDFLLRMTGDLKFSSDVNDHTMLYIIKSPHHWKNIDNLRLSIYKKAVKESTQHFYPNVSKLRHKTLRNDLSNPQISDRDRLRSTAFNNLHHGINTLDIESRMVLLLHAHCHFSFACISEIAQIDRNHVIEIYQNALEKLALIVPRFPKNPRGVISELINMPFSDDIAVKDTDLLEFVTTLRKDRKEPKSHSGFYYLVVLIVCAFMAQHILAPRSSMIRKVIHFIERMK